MELRETLARIFGKPSQEKTLQKSGIEKPKNEALSPTAQDRLNQARQREEKEKMGQLTHKAYRTQSGQEITAPPGTGPLELQKSRQKIAAEQSIEKGAEWREKFTPKGTPGERFRRLTQAETKKDTSSPEQIAEKKTPETAAKPVGETLSERKTREIDHELLSKSITKPTWPKEKAQEKTPIEQKGSVPPFKPGTFPGVEKWQPGKGAISIDEAEKIREKLKTKPAYSPEELKEHS